MTASLFLLPHKEGGAECLHRHDDIYLHPYAFLSLPGRLFQTPVLLGVPEQVVLDEASIIIAIEGNKGIFHAAIGYQHYLLINGRGLVVPGFDHDSVEREGFEILCGGVGFGPLRVEPVTGQKTGYADELRADLFGVSFLSITMSDCHLAASLVGVSGFQGKLASVGGGGHVLFERDDKLNALLINGKKHLAVEEAAIDNQGTDCALGTDIFLGLFQYGKNVEIVRLFYGIDLNCQGDSGIELINGPNFPAINRHFDSLEFTIPPVTPRLDLAISRYLAAAFELAGGLKIGGIASRMDVFGENVQSGQLLNAAIEKPLDGPGSDFDDLLGQRIDTNGSPDLGCRRGPKLNAPLTAAVSDLVPIETTDSHEELIGEKEFVHGLHLWNGSNDFHEKNQDELNEGDMLSFLVLGGNAFQQREDLNLPQVLKEEVEEGGFIEGKDRIHLFSSKEVVCHLGIVPFRGMPEEPFPYGLLHLLSSGHVQTPGRK